MHRLFSYLLLIYLLQWTSQPWSYGERRLFANQWGDDLRRITIEAIDSAQTSLLLFAYQIHDEEFFQALHRASERGVTVEIVLDRNLAKKRKLFSPKNRLITTKRIQHLKAIVVDRALLLLTSANFTFEAFRLQPNGLLRLENSSFAELFYKKKELVAHSTHTPLHEKSSQGNEELWLLPHPQALHRLIEAIDKAEQLISCALFSFTSEPLFAAIARAHARGVQVTLYLDASQAQGAGRPLIERLEQNHIPHYLIQPLDVMHHKLALIDTTLFLGSSNWTIQGMEKNIEAFVLLSPILYEEQRIVQRIFRDLHTMARRQ